MAGSVNLVVLVGNLGADPESRTTAGGTMVSQLRLATSSREKKDDGWTDVTEWHRVVVFGKPAEFAAKLKKGAKVAIEGRLKTRKWADKEGVDRYTTEVVAHNLTALSAKEESGPSEDETPF